MSVAKEYPEGSIKSVDDLYNASRSYPTPKLWRASKHFKLCYQTKESCMGVTFAAMCDMNVYKLNGYNDWFWFVNEADAKAYAGVE